MNNAEDIVNRRIAKFEKVSYEQFLKDTMDTFQLLDIHEKYVKDMYDNIKLPKRATAGSAGYDFFSPVDFELKPGETIKIPTGIRCEMNNDWVLQIFPRSGLGFKYRCQLDNTVGIIDSDYFYSDNEGHIFIKITNDTKVNYDDYIDDIRKMPRQKIEIKRGEGFAQGIFLPYGLTVDDDCTGVRNGGFGSTDKKE